MDTIITKLRVWRIWKALERVVAVAVYEDSSTESRVDEFRQGFSLELGQNCSLDKQMWPLSELRMPQLRAIAAADAANADLIIISVRAAESLPDAVQNWIDLWAKRKGNRPAVLLALFDRLERGSSTSIQIHLKEVAKRTKMEFLVQSDESVEER
jgi:hypothetical protein